MTWINKHNLSHLYKIKTNKMHYHCKFISVSVKIFLMMSSKWIVFLIVQLMSLKNPNQIDRIVLQPGDYYVTDQDVILSTLLGSCVSACLYDPINKIIGMNHFLLSSVKYSTKTPLCISDAGRYGVHAMELMINKMLTLGAKRFYLKAKVFGGGNVLSFGFVKDRFFTVGDLNVQFIREYLINEKIPLIAYDVGGERGRVIRFHSDSYSVFVRKIKKSASINLIKRDKKYWKHSLRKQATANADIELW